MCTMELDPFCLDGAVFDRRVYDSVDSFARRQKRKFKLP